MIDEVYVIEDSGIPFYYYRGGGVSLVDNSFYTLQSGLFTALMQFAAELGEGELKYVVFSGKTYTFSKSKNLLLVIGMKGVSDKIDFSSSNQMISKSIRQIEDSIPGGKESLIYELSDKQISDFEDSFGNFLVREKMIEQPSIEETKSLRSVVQGLALKSIGYTPGVCNIGRTERLKRLMGGFVVLVVTLILFGIIALIDAIPTTTFFLVLPMMMFFMFIYQSFSKFCVKNAVTRQYNMN